MKPISEGDWICRGCLMRISVLSTRNGRCLSWILFSWFENPHLGFRFAMWNCTLNQKKMAIERPVCFLPPKKHVMRSHGSETQTTTRDAKKNLQIMGWTTKLKWCRISSINSRIFLCNIFRIDVMFHGIGIIIAHQMELQVTYTSTIKINHSCKCR